MTHGAMRATLLTLVKLKRKQKGKKGKREREKRREGEERKERVKRGSTFSLLSTDIGWLDLVGPRVKAHLLGEG